MSDAMNRPRILCVTTRIPAADIHGDALRAWHLLRGLSQHYRITLMCLDATGAATIDGELRGFCEDIVVVRHPRPRAAAGALWAMASGRPAQCGWFDSAELRARGGEAARSGRFEAAVVQLARLDRVVDALAPLPVVIDFVDALSLQWARRRQGSRFPASLFHTFESRNMQRAERRLLEACGGGLVTGADDARHLESLSTEAVHVRVLPNGVATDHFQPRVMPGGTATAAPVVMFSGNLDYRPNQDAVAWFARNVLPHLRQEIPGLRFVAAGKMTRTLLLPLETSHGVEFTGYVDDMAATIATADVCVASMVSGAGIQNKVLEAMASGRPVVATRLANAGINARHGAEIMIAADPTLMARAILDLLADPARAAALGLAGRDFVARRFGWQVQADVVAEHVQGAITDARRRARLLGAPASRNRAARNSRPDPATGRLVYRFLRVAVHGFAFVMMSATALVLLPFAWLVLTLGARQPRYVREEVLGIDRRLVLASPPKLERRLFNLGGRPFSRLALQVEPVTGFENPVTYTARLVMQAAPQVWNLLKRDVNLVGPRPGVRRASASDVAPGGCYPSRRGVRPGLCRPERAGGDDRILVAELTYRLRRQRASQHLRADARALVRVFFSPLPWVR
jgi:sugar transferase (PEP-CTERM/EpsH1 system associated)